MKLPNLPGGRTRDWLTVVNRFLDQTEEQDLITWILSSSGFSTFPGTWPPNREGNSPSRYREFSRSWVTLALWSRQVGPGQGKREYRATGVRRCSMPYRRRFNFFNQSRGQRLLSRVGKTYAYLDTRVLRDLSETETSPSIWSPDTGAFEFFDKSELLEKEKKWNRRTILKWQWLVSIINFGVSRFISRCYKIGNLKICFEFQKID